MSRVNKKRATFKNVKADAVIGDAQFEFFQQYGRFPELGEVKALAFAGAVTRAARTINE